MDATRRTILACSAALVWGCSAAVSAATTVGSGQVVTLAREVPGFEAVDLAGSLQLVVSQSAAQRVSVTADDNLQPLIETVVETQGGVRRLKVRLRDGTSIRHRGEIVVHLEVVRLSALRVAGSGSVQVSGLQSPSLSMAIAGAGDARLSGLSTDRLEVRVAGSGDVKADGRARELRLSIAGSGDASLRELIADDVSVRIAGSGDVDVTAQRSLEVSIAGSGDVRYGGDVPQVKSSIVGSGDVRRR